MPIVYNKHNCGPLIQMSQAVYIGRPSKWGNPFVIGRDGTRDEVIAKFEQYLFGNPELLAAVMSELKGRDVMCFCAPAACHGDVLVRVANATD